MDDAQPVDKPVDDGELLTPAEMSLVHDIGALAPRFDELAGDGPQAGNDLREVVALIHALQDKVLAQAAARAYPALYRRFGASMTAIAPDRLATCLDCGVVARLEPSEDRFEDEWLHLDVYPGAAHPARVRDACETCDGTGEVATEAQHGGVPAQTSRCPDCSPTPAPPTLPAALTVMVETLTEIGVTVTPQTVLDARVALLDARGDEREADVARVYEWLRGHIPHIPLPEHRAYGRLLDGIRRALQEWRPDRDSQARVELAGDGVRAYDAAGRRTFGRAPCGIPAPLVHEAVSMLGSRLIELGVLPGAGGPQDGAAEVEYEALERGLLNAWRRTRDPAEWTTALALLDRELSLAKTVLTELGYRYDQGEGPAFPPSAEVIAAVSGALGMLPGVAEVPA